MVIFAKGAAGAVLKEASTARPPVFQTRYAVYLGRKPPGDGSIERSGMDIKDVRGMYRLLAIDEELDGVDLRVFLYLFSRLDFENFTRVEHRDIIEALGRRREHVSRSIRKLKEKKVILEASPKVGRSSAYLLNPKFGK